MPRSIRFAAFAVIAVLLAAPAIPALHLSGASTSGTLTAAGVRPDCANCLI